MNPEIDPNEEQSQNAAADSFYEPRTIPKNWDVSAIPSRGTPARKGITGHTTEAREPQEIEDLEDSTSITTPDPFPQPRTIPGKWDVSGLK